MGKQDDRAVRLYINGDLVGFRFFGDNQCFDMGLDAVKQTGYVVQADSKIDLVEHAGSWMTKKEIPLAPHLRVQDMSLEPAKLMAYFEAVKHTFFARHAEVVSMQVVRLEAEKRFGTKLRWTKVTYLQEGEEIPLAYYVLAEVKYAPARIEWDGKLDDDFEEVVYDTGGKRISSGIYGVCSDEELAISGYFDARGLENGVFTFMTDNAGIDGFSSEQVEQMRKYTVSKYPLVQK